MARTHAAASSGGQSRPPSPTTSGTAVVDEATTGEPQAIASNGGQPNPSYTEGKQKTAALLYQRTSSSCDTNSRNRTSASTPSCRIVRIVVARKSASPPPARPTLTSFKPGKVRFSSLKTPRRNGTFLRGCSEPTYNRYCSSKGLPPGCGEKVASTPCWMTSMRPGSRPR